MFVFLIVSLIDSVVSLIAFMGKYDIVLNDFENIEDGSEDIAVRLWGWFTRKFTGKTIRQDRESRKKNLLGIEDATDVVGKDARAIANLAEEESKDAAILVTEDTKDIAIFTEKKTKSFANWSYEKFMNLFTKNEEKDLPDSIDSQSGSPMGPFFPDIPPADPVKAIRDTTESIKETIKNTNIGSYIQKF